MGITAASHASSKQFIHFPTAPTYVGTWKKPQPPLWEQPPLPNKCYYSEPPSLHSHVSFFCHKSTGHWAAEAANLPHFPTGSICPEACLAGSSTWPTSLISGVIQPFAKPGRFLPGGMQPPSILGFLKCMCTRPPGRYYLFLRMMQLPPSWPHFFPLALQLFFSHAMPHTCTATYGPQFTSENHPLQPLSGAPTYLHFRALVSASSCSRALFKLGCLP